MIDGFKSDEPWLRRELVAPWTQIVAVLAVVIGLFTVNSTWKGLHGSSQHYVTDILNDSRMLHGIALESAMFTFLFLFLSRRGWKPSDFQIKPGIRSSFLGVGMLIVQVIGNLVTVTSLFVLYYLLFHRGESPLTFLMGNSPHLQAHSIVISWFTIVPAMVLNAYFEEITCMAYGFNQLAAKWGPSIALPVIVLLRMSCHTYQGLIHALGIGVVFTISGLVYWRTRNLWPLVFSHALLDLSSLGLVKIIFGAP